jgi:hypothetical protein
MAHERIAERAINTIEELNHEQQRLGFAPWLAEFVTVAGN